MRLLLVEDDKDLVNQLKPDLKKAGFAVDVAVNGTDAEYLGNENIHDIVILDLGLPEKSGLDVLKSWRNSGNHIPVIILTARDSWQERVDGFNAGADDYVGKPFHVQELVARLSALMHRSHQKPAGTIELDGTILNEEQQCVITRDGECHALTGTEFRLLRYMMLNAGKILSKSRLAEHVYDLDSDKDSNVIEAYIKRLRKILGKQRIETRRGQGYIFRMTAE